MPTVEQALRSALIALGGEQARTDADLLLAHALGQSRTWLYSHGSDNIEPAVYERFQGFIQRRRLGEPVAYITGQGGFWSMDFTLTTDTLIPRPETELLVELALARIPPFAKTRVLDLGTGSGAIALAIARERPQAIVTALDASVPALAIARSNAGMLGLDRVRVLHSDWYSAVAGECFDLVVSNPPYISDDDPHLMQGDLRHEPRSALASGHDGLEAIRCIVHDASQHLAEGWLLIEHGWQQGEAVRDLFAAASFSAIETVRDLEQRERVTLGRVV